MGYGFDNWGEYTNSLALSMIMNGSSLWQLWIEIMDTDILPGRKTIQQTILFSLVT